MELWKTTFKSNNSLNLSLTLHLVITIVSYLACHPVHLPLGRPSLPVHQVDPWIQVCQTGLVCLQIQGLPADRLDLGLLGFLLLPDLLGPLEIQAPQGDLAGRQFLEILPGPIVLFHLAALEILVPLGTLVLLESLVLPLIQVPLADLVY